MFKNACLKKHSIDPKSEPTLAEADREAVGERMIGGKRAGQFSVRVNRIPSPGPAAARLTCTKIRRLKSSTGVQVPRRRPFLRDPVMLRRSHPVVIRRPRPDIGNCYRLGDVAPVLAFFARAAWLAGPTPRRGHVARLWANVRPSSGNIPASKP